MSTPVQKLKTSSLRPVRSRSAIDSAASVTSSCVHSRPAAPSTRTGASVGRSRNANGEIATPCRVICGTSSDLDAVAAQDLDRLGEAAHVDDVVGLELDVEAILELGDEGHVG